MTTSPNTANYTIFKGVVSWCPSGSSTYRDLGNAPQLQITPNVEFLDHFSSRTGVRKKDASVAVQQSAEVTLTLDEMTADNIALGILGSIENQETGDPGFIASPGQGQAQRRKVLAMTEAEVIGALRYVGTNSVGKRFQVDIPRVSFKGGNALSLISEEWGTLELTGEILEPDTAGEPFFTLYEIA